MVPRCMCIAMRTWAVLQHFAHPSIGSDVWIGDSAQQVDQDVEELGVQAAVALAAESRGLTGIKHVELGVLSISWLARVEHVGVVVHGAMDYTDRRGCVPRAAGERFDPSTKADEAQGRIVPPDASSKVTTAMIAPQQQASQRLWGFRQRGKVGGLAPMAAERHTRWLSNCLIRKVPGAAVRALQCHTLESQRLKRMCRKSAQAIWR